jgi:TolA-binding protein
MKRMLILYAFCFFVFGGCIHLTEHSTTSTESTPPAFTKAQELFGDGQYRAAIEVLRQFIQDEPRSSRSDDAAYFLALCYYRLGDDSLAIEVGRSRPCGRSVFKSNRSHK